MRGGTTAAQRAADAVESGVEVAKLGADDERADAFQRLADGLTAGDFGDAGAGGVVLQNDDDAGEERAMRSREVQQHAVMAGDRDDLHFGDGGGGGWRHAHLRYLQG